MSMVIQHNIPALQSYNIVNNTSNALQKSIAKLSSGLRINSAADDAAGLAISEKMRSQIRGLDKAISNTQDGISMIQTAEGALSETHSILQRMRELSVQAANDTLTQQDRSYIQVEMDQLKEEVTRIGNTTQFNKKKLLNGDSSALWSSDDLETKAIINGGLREIDQFGQKKSIEGNYKIRVKADPGQGEVQKSDIMKIKHNNVVMNKMVNEPLGVTDVTINDMAAGHYNIKTGAAPTAAAGTGTVTGSYAIGGKESTRTNAITFAAVGAPVTKVSVQTTDGTELWSMEGSNLFSYDGTNDTADTAQAAFFGYTHYDEIKAAAKDKGVLITTAKAASAAAATSPLSMDTKTLEGDAPGIKIVYTTTAASSTQPTTAIGAASAGDAKSASDAFALTVKDTNKDNGSILFEVTGIDNVNNTVTLKATATRLSQAGVNSTATMDNIVIANDDSTGVDLKDLGVGLTLTSTANMADYVNTVGGKFVMSYKASAAETTGAMDTAITIDGTLDSTWDDK